MPWTRFEGVSGLRGDWGMGRISGVALGERERISSAPWRRPASTAAAQGDYSGSMEITSPFIRDRRPGPPDSRSAALAANLAWIVIFAVAGAVGGPLAAEEADRAPRSMRLLFVGNSYTAGQGGVADLVRRTAAARGITVEVAQVAPGGYTLEQHWSNSAGTRDRIAEGWDWVFLQEQSTRPITDPDAFHTYARLLDQDIRAAGGRTGFFLTWAREFAPETQADLNTAYCGIAQELGARVVPVGMAWALSRERDPTLGLHLGDGSHQNDLGQYLLGMVFHRRLWNDPPSGLPHDVSPMVVVNPGDAAYFQQVAVDAPMDCPPRLFDDDFEIGSLLRWSAAVP
ncbi:MAG: SGNH/GDSL hydrolase family protein [Acidobacteriota bacterium]